MLVLSLQSYHRIITGNYFYDDTPFLYTALENDCFTKSNSLTCFKEQEKKTVYVATIHAAVPHFKAKLVSVLSRIMVQLKLVIILSEKSDS